MNFNLVPESEQNRSIIEHPAIKDFIVNRNIKEEDFELIKKFGVFAKNFIIQNFHNFFQSASAQENSLQALDELMRWSKDDSDLKKNLSAV